MDPHVYFNKKRINQKIEIESGQSFKRTIEVWWPSFSTGIYDLTLYYGDFDIELASNKLTIEIK